MKTQWLGITRALAIAGVTNFQFVDDEARWRGSEIHRLIELADRGTLDEKSIPADLRGYREAHRKFNKETGFIPQQIEFKVQDKDFGVRGRIDRAGLMKGKRAIVDFKTGVISEAVALQLCLGGNFLKPGEWFRRYGVRLKADGTYSVKEFRLMEWHADLATALACCRVAKWKLKHGIA